MQHLIPYIVVAFIYLAVAVDFWRIAKPSQSPTEWTQSLKLHSAMIALALVLHGWLLYRDIFAVGGFSFGLYYAISAILWLTVLIYWLANLWLAGSQNQLHSLQAFALPPTAVFVLLSAFAIKSYDAPAMGQTTLFVAHVAVAILAYSLFTFATLHALLMAVAERTLHNKPTLIKLPSFPPLMVMESLLFRVVSIGFVLLTLAIISGMLFSEQIFGKPLQLSHKVIFTIASWGIYGWLLFGRYQYGWRGRKAIHWTLAGFGLLLLAYVGSKFVSEVLLSQ